MSVKLRVNEIFYSVQGEGSTIGEPAVFVRLQGCNLYCFWCDTKYALKRQGGEEIEISNVLEKIKEFSCLRVVFTGGEPLLQQEGLLEVIKNRKAPYINEIETNGTILPSVYLDEIENIKWNVSPKLKSSGMTKKLRIRRAIISHFAEREAEFKFVIQDQEDFEEAVALCNEFDIFNVIIMPEGRTQEEIAKKAKWLVRKCQRYEFRLLPRLQVMIWGNKKGV